MDSIFAQPDDSMYLALSTAEARFALSIVRSRTYLTEAYADALLGLVSADTLWTLGLILAAWAIATIVGGPLAVAVDGLLIAYGLYSLYEQLAATWAGLRTWARSAYHARSEAQLEEAARDFAATVAAGSLDLLTVLVTHKVFVKVQRTLGSRFPKPKWLEDEMAAAKEEHAQRQAKGEQQKPPLRPEEGAPAKVKDEPRKQNATLRTLAEPAMNLGRAAGARPQPQNSVTLPVVILGGAIVLGGAAALTAVAMGGNRGYKK